MRVGRLLARDPQYLALWLRTHDIGAMEHAGFFDDGMSRDEREALGLAGDHTHAAHGLWQTPWPHIDVDDERPLVALLATGAFAPLHGGHVGMMDAAVDACLARGWRVVAGYFSPSHDLYVKDKDGGRAAHLNAPLRIQEARAVLEVGRPNASAGVSYFVDPWEAMAASRPLNFTDVARRLECYLRRQMGRDVHVGFVFGADNGGFSQVFAEHGLGVCVGRPGYEGSSVDGNGKPLYPGSPDGVCLHAHAAKDISSTQQRIEHNKRSVLFNDLPARGTYVLRNEGRWAWEHWAGRADSAELEQAWGDFTRGVKSALRVAFNDHAMRLHGPALSDYASTWPRPDRWLDLALEAQQATVREWGHGQALLNMDPCSEHLPGSTGWPWSRRFMVAAHQVQAVAYGVRPGGVLPQVLPEQVVLVDDDCASGATLASAMQALMGKTEILEARFLVPASLPGQTVFDVVDYRDFLPGSREGGLVVGIGGGAVRVPYMAPFVDLSTRGRIPPTQCHALSRKLWELAEGFFSALSTPLCVEDMHAGSRNAFLAQGFAPDMELAQLCRQMGQHLPA
jgi:hypothetical protein